MKKYQEILQDLGYGIVKAKFLYENKKIHDIEILDFNKKIEDFVHNNPTIIIKKTIKETFKEDPIMLNLMEGFINNIDKINNKTICIYSKNSGKYYEITSYVEDNGAVFILKDVTKKNETDVELEKVQRRLNIALDIGKIAWWEMNVQTGKVNFHKNKAELLDYSKKEFPKDMYEIMKLVHPDDYEKTMEAMKKHLNGEEETYNVEYRIKDKNNKYHWFYDQGQIVERDKEGNPLNLIGVVMEITERKESERKLEKLANYDGLTKAYNRRMGLIILKENLKYARRNKNHLTISFLDQDNLKEVNDILGHDYGDESLKIISNTIKEEIRDSDIICRMGGDEFLIIFPDCNRDNARKIVSRIRNKINEKNNNLDFNISFSAGFYEYDGKSDIRVDEFIKIADSDMYEEKNVKKQYLHNKNKRKQ